MSKSKGKLKTNKIKRKSNTELLATFCNNFDVNVKQISPYHFRLSKDGFTKIDVFPTSSKVHILKEDEDYKQV